MNPQQAQAMLDKLYQDVCDGIEQQLRVSDCLELREGDQGLAGNDICEIANILAHRGVHNRLFSMKNEPDKLVLVIGSAVPRV